MSADDVPPALDTDGAATSPSGSAPEVPVVRDFRLEVVEGDGRGLTWQARANPGRCAIGSHAANDLVLDDATVSRFHCELRIEPRGARVRDLDSTNGTFVDGVPVADAFLRGGSLVRIGRSVVRFDFGAEHHALALSVATQFGSLVGASIPMRATFALLERAAESDATVLLEGETGTGKEGAAEAIHQASTRRQRPFIVVDCSAIPEALLESELFGHEKGAFTGAAARRVGAFEEAHGGTIFLDEIGELPADLQPKLLRALEQREVRRVGSNLHLPVDVRVIAATNRDLRGEVNAGRFRADLYYRLAVLRIVLPPLRSRLDDLPILVTRILTALGADAAALAALTAPELIAGLGRAAWPGNVRELRNYLERCLVFHQPLPLGDAEGAAPPLVDPAQPYDEVRRRVLDDFERRYVAGLLQLHRGNISAAARAAGVDRAYIYRLARRHQLKT